ncbi:strawberry notch family protein [Mesorhizobium australicum]|uniref:Methyltransferase domain-containing protein n=1 Tax=Mesorhizobium australicum TaxID=536018 RepID=A0A1X7MN89_9HYPH|nr:strawberry notch family protein [Mesorhizobium australicum]SMH26280.1 Methyltransferase domain-containing protein [Mesorhizobium australicum]
MNIVTNTSTVSRTAVPLAAAASRDIDTVQAIYQAAAQLLPFLEQGKPITTAALGGAMTESFGGTDAQGFWVWKDAYEALETAQILFLRRFGSTILSRSSSPQAALAMMKRIAELLPTHTRRSDESQAMQQLSTPLPLAFVTAHAAAISSSDLVLEPSAGTGLLAVHADIARASLALNELAATRADLLGQLFPRIPVSRHDAAHIDDHLDPAVEPSVVLMNPPFTVGAYVDGHVADAAWRHLSSAFARLRAGGRLVAITGTGLSPENPKWRPAFERLQQHGRVVFTAAIDGRVYARHGTTAETRLTIIDKTPATDPASFAASPGKAADVGTLLSWISDLPPRTPGGFPDSIGTLSNAILRDAARQMAARLAAGSAPIVVSAVAKSMRPVPSVARAKPVRPVMAATTPAVPLAYELRDWMPEEGGQLTETIYEPYALQSIDIPRAKPHPTPLVQSAAMAAVAPPKPSYRPLLPDAIIDDGLLSDAQIESVIYAGEAHSSHLAGAWSVNETCDVVSAAPEGAENAVRFRRGWFLGDGTGCGKGRQVAGIILDNWQQGRRRAIWISKSDKLLEDAQRDWAALGQERLLVQPLSRYRQGTPIRLAEGILFTTYATLRSQERDGKKSRIAQIIDWVSEEAERAGGPTGNKEDSAGRAEGLTLPKRPFDGVIVFDEAHAMANAAGGKSERGDVAPSQQGKAGLRLQHALPDARIVYGSATGATAVENLAYAQRLGIWGSEDFPFANRAEFVSAIEDGGVAAMEVLARDLKSLGLYTSRSLSYDGVEYDLLEHELTEEQIRIYNAYADAFQVIHNNLTAALEAANITSETGTLNRNAKAAARSAFESTKQRFFSHLITSMMTPTLIGAIERDRADGHSSVVQIVSTGEALMERRLADIPTEEWSDLHVDVTPREYVGGYLMHSFPTQLFEEYSDAEGNVYSQPVHDEDGNPVLCREAVRRRDEMIEKLASLPPVGSALDQILHHFGTDVVAEVTGRSRRIVRKTGRDGIDRLAVETRPGSANLAETQSFMDDGKSVLIFSDAGGTGRSYHADLGAKNQRLRKHYLLEAGWRADNAIQGLGRTHRTNQAQPPLFRPMAANVKAGKRFLSTIARRLDTLGAITRGQRQTGGAGLFRSEDNLESPYARAALRQFYYLLHQGKIEGCSLTTFEAVTGLSLTTDEGGLRDELPPITTWLNRLLALRIETQNLLFEVFEQLMAAKVEGAIAAGTFDKGLETITAESITVTDRRTIYTHPVSGAQSHVLTVARKDRIRPLGLTDALAIVRAEPQSVLLVNTRSSRAAIQLPTASLMLDDGAIEHRVRLLRPTDELRFGLDALAETHWQPADRKLFSELWQAEVAAVPEFTTSTFHIVTGLLLPIWRRLPDHDCQVYRIQTDAGERIIGRHIAPTLVATMLRNLGIDHVPTLAPEDAWTGLVDGRIGLQLADGLVVRRSRVMSDYRVELIGFTAAMVPRLKALGLISEIISWKLRLFIPTRGQGCAMLASLLERHTLVGITDRAAAA